MEMDKKEFLTDKVLWIYGIGRQQKDFEYVFDDVKIHGYLVSKSNDQYLNGKSVYSLIDFFKQDNAMDNGIIVCVSSREKEIVEKMFSEYGLCHRKDFFFAEELFTILDAFQERIAARPVVLWGTGRFAENFLENADAFYNVEFFIDNDIKKKNTIFNGCLVKHPSELSIDEWKNHYFIVGTSYYFSIRKQLESHGLRENDDFVDYSQAVPLSVLFKKTYMDNVYYELDCQSMLTHLDLSARGRVDTCCATFLNVSVGNLLVQDMNDIWKSRLHKILCVSILNRTYSFCKKNICPALLNKEKQEYDEKHFSYTYQKIAIHAPVANIAIDFSCNLYCETCRTHVQVASLEDQKELLFLADKVLEQVVPYTHFIMMAGNGEVFLSKAYEKIWSSYKSKKCEYFQVLSNGILFTKEKWNKLIKGRDSEILFCVSIDAATKQTYQKLRRGGEWDKLIDNMKFAAGLKKEGKIKYFRLNFVVQRENYKEIPEFIKLGISLGCDRILFTKLLNWGTYTEEEFEKRSMVDLDGKPRVELQKILNESICQDPIVDIGTLKGQHNYQEATTISNYYLWEIDNYSTLKLSDNILKQQV